MRHSDLLKRAKDAIDQLHSDTSVSASKTLQSLRDVKEHLETTIEALEATAGGGDDLDDE
jgi:Mg2+ and Co2+ transporter CorA